MHDGVRLEIAGRPTAVVVTSEFVHEADMQKEALGMPDLSAVVIDHPLSTLTEEAIDQRAREAASQCAAIWLGRTE